MERKPKNKRLYRKAREIFSLSKHISDYLVYDLSDLEENGRENPHIYFTGDMIRQSDALAPEIIKAENHMYQDDRIRHANSLIAITNKLYKNCERLEKSKSNGKDFLKVLRVELKKFKKLQHHWMMTL